MVQLWGGKVIQNAMSDVNYALLEPCVKGFLSAWASLPGSVRDALPSSIIDAVDRIARLFKAVGLLLDIPDCGKGIGDCQYLRNYKGPLSLEKSCRTILTDNKSHWEKTYQEVIKTAASSKLVSPIFEKLKVQFGSGSSSFDLSGLPDILANFTEVKGAMRKGLVKGLEIKFHRALVTASNDLLQGKLAVPRVSTMEALLTAFKGPLSQQAGALDMASSLQTFMNNKSKDMSLAELECCIQLGGSVESLAELDFGKLQKYVRQCQVKGAMVMEGEARVDLVNTFLHNVITLLYRKDRLLQVLQFAVCPWH